MENKHSEETEKSAIRNTKHNETNDTQILIDHVQLPTLWNTKYAEQEINIEDGFNLDAADRRTVNGIAILGLGQDNTNYRNIFEDRDTSPEVHLNGVDIKTQYPTSKHKKGKLSKRGAKSSASRALGLTGIKQIPLPHSGFWITLDVIPRANRLVLEQQLAHREIELSISTATLIYSAPRLIYIRTIMEFISNFIIDTTLELPDNEDITDHISVLDIDVLVLEVVKLFYPKGFNASISCENVYELDGSSTLCQHTITGLVDLDMVYRYDKNYVFSDEQKEILSRRQSGSVTITESNDYQTSFSNNAETVKHEFKVSDSLIVIEFELCSIREYIDVTTKFKTNLEDLVDDVLMGDENHEVRLTKLEEVSKDLILVAYIHFIKSLDINGELTTDKSAIYDSVSVFMDDPVLVEDILTKLTLFIDNNLIAMVCTPSYTCPNCRKVVPVEGTEPKKPFNQMIALDVLDVFTELRIKGL